MIIVSKTEGNVIKHYFEVPGCKVVQAMVESYANLIAGKSISEVQAITSDYPKRFQSLNFIRSRSTSIRSKN